MTAPSCPHSNGYSSQCFDKNDAVHPLFCLPAGEKKATDLWEAFNTPLDPASIIAAHEHPLPPAVDPPAALAQPAVSNPTALPSPSLTIASPTLGGAQPAAAGLLRPNPLLPTRSAPAPTSTVFKPNSSLSASPMPAPAPQPDLLSAGSCQASGLPYPVPPRPACQGFQPASTLRPGSTPDLCSNLQPKVQVEHPDFASVAGSASAELTQRAAKRDYLHRQGHAAMQQALQRSMAEDTESDSGDDVPAVGFKTH